MRLPILLLSITLTLSYLTASAREDSDHYRIEHTPLADTTVTGRITDSAGNALPNVSVVIKSRNEGTTTDANGNFTLRNVPSRATLVISSIGFLAREIRLASGQTIVALSLSSDPGTLTDVIITGFQRIDKSKFTGAAVKLDMDRIKTPGQTDVSRMLEGRAAGVAIQNVSGTFGSAPKVRIRGATTIPGRCNSL